MNKIENIKDLINLVHKLISGNSEYKVELTEVENALKNFKPKNDEKQELASLKKRVKEWIPTPSSKMADLRTIIRSIPNRH
jgi:hypothetical protein